MKSLFLVFTLLPSFFLTQISFQINGKFGFKLNEQVIIEPSYEYATDFEGELACVKLNGKWGYIDKQNTWVSSQYDRVQPLIQGFGKVLSNGMYGLIDSTGKEVLKPEYQEIRLAYGWFDIKKNEDWGLYSKDIQIPCKYKNVGLNDRGFAYGELDNNRYDIYDNSGLVLADQEHTFSQWNIKLDDNIICVKEGRYGLFSTVSKEWVLTPEFDYILTLHTGDYQEYNREKEIRNYNFVYVVFKDLQDEINYYNLMDKTEAINDIVILKASSLDVLVDEVSGYRKYSLGKSWRDGYSYDLNCKGKSHGLDLNTLLGIDNDIPSSYEFRGASINQEEGGAVMTFVYSTVHALSIKPFKYNVTSIDEAGAAYEDSKILYEDYLLMKFDDHYGIYSLRFNRIIVDDLPLNTVFEVKKFDEWDDFEIIYRNEGKCGIITRKIPNGTAIEFVETHSVDHYKYLKAKRSVDGKYGIYKITDLAHEICEADDFDLYRFGGDYFIRAIDNDKTGVFNGHGVESYFDEIYDINHSRLVGTRKGNKFGLYDTDYHLHADGLMDSIRSFEEWSFYPYIFIEQDQGNWLGIDGRVYPSSEPHEMLESGNGFYKVGVMKYSDIEEKIFLSPGRFKDFRDESYPYFRVKGENNLWGIVNQFGDTILDFKYTDFGWGEHGENMYDGYDDYLFYSYTKNGMGIVSAKNGELMPCRYKYFEQDYDVLDYSLNAFKIYSKTGVGYYLYPQGEVIPPIYKDIFHSNEYLDWSSDTLLVTDKKKRMGFIGINGNVVLPVEYTDMSYYPGEYYQTISHDYVISLQKGKLYGVYSPKRNKMIVPVNFEKVVDGEYYRNELTEEEAEVYTFTTYLKGKKGMYNYFGDELLPAIFDELNVYPLDYGYTGADVLVYGKFEEKYYANIFNNSDSSITEEFSLNKGYDKILGFTGLSYENGEISGYDFQTKEIIELASEMTVKGELFDIYFSKGKFGAKDKEGNVLVEAIYDDADFFFARRDVMIGIQDGVFYYIYVDSNTRYTKEEW